MKLGSAAVNLVTDGTLSKDGGALFGRVPKMDWEQAIKPDRRNRVKMGINLLLIQTPKFNILVDTGLGSKSNDMVKDTYSLNGNKLSKSLKHLNLSPKDISLIILSHLQFDRAGGCTKLDRSGKLVPAFPKAKHLVQKVCLEESKEPSEIEKSFVNQDDFLPLIEKDLIEELDGESEIIPGIKTQITGGPSMGHQIVFIEWGSERIVYAGSIIPTRLHINPQHVAAYDVYPHETLEWKKKLIDMAVNDGWLLVFGNEVGHSAGYLSSNSGNLAIQPIEL
jgi:glyoxylase-like metal-dependent hydrolase (beta-lactamase superfamily II)